MKKVKDLMTKRVVAFTPEDTIFKAAKTFCRRNISGAPVIKDKKNKEVIGVVSESDIVQFIGFNVCTPDISDNVAGDYVYQSLTLLFFNMVRMGKSWFDARKEVRRISKTKIKDVMTKDALYATPEMTIFEAASKMKANDVNRLPVLDDKNRLVGIIARQDILKALI